MFLFHSSLALTYLSLAAGTTLIVWAMRKKEPGYILAKFVGIIIFALSLSSFICSMYFATLFLMAGQTPWGTSIHMIKHGKITHHEEHKGMPE